MPDSLYSFSRQYRLLNKQDFQSIFSGRPRKISHRSFLALYQFNHLDYARLGIVIGKRFAKRAVDRNRLKRLIRESFRLHKIALNGLDIVVILCSKYDALNTTLHRTDIDDLWPVLINGLPLV